MQERYFTLFFPEDLVREPLLYSLVRRFGLVPQVFRASVTGTGGWLVISLKGEKEAIETSMLELKCRGAQVIEGDSSIIDISEPPKTSSVRIRLTIPQTKVTEPIYSDIIKKHDVVMNIRQARIDAEQGLIDMEMTGTLESIDDAIDWMKTQGIGVDPIEGNVIE